jgi:hypothetical protein
MRKFLVTMVLMLSAVPMFGQLSYVPPANAAYCLHAGHWIPVAAQVGTPLSFVPPAVGIYGENGTSWYAMACDASGNLLPGGAAGGDLSGTYPNPTVAQVNGAAIPVSKTVVGTNSSGQIVDASSATLANNTTGTATNATNVATTAKSDNTNYYLALLGSNTSTNQGVNVDSAGLAYYNPSASTFTAPYTTAPAASSATDSASLGPELTTSGTCTGTGWTGTYPNYIAPGTTAALTCTGFTSGSYYQTVTGITNNAGVTAATYVSGISATGSGTCLLAFTGGGGSGATASIAVTSNVPGVITITSPGTAFTSAPTAATVSNGTLTCTGPAVLTSTIGGGTVTVAIGTAQPATSASTASSTLTTGPKANATSLTYTPTAAFVGTMNISAKLISPITTFSYTGKDSTGAVSTTVLYQGLASLHNIFEGGGGTYNTTGIYNSAQGSQALYSNTTGSYNSAQGYNALYSNTTGIYNSAQGSQALYYNTTGSDNSAQGYTALYSNTTGYYNSAQGYQALFSNTTGSYNSAQGLNALYYNTTGIYNSAQGFNAGRYINDGSTANQTSSNSVYLGASTEAKANGDTNENVIGNGAVGNGSNTTTLGNSSVTATYLAGITLPLVIYSHAGTQLAACASGLQGGMAVVSDATALVPGTAYSVTAGAGADTVRVQCTLVSGTYAWQTM